MDALWLSLHFRERLTRRQAFCIGACRIGADFCSGSYADRDYNLAADYSHRFHLSPKYISFKDITEYSYAAFPNSDIITSHQSDSAGFHQ